VPDRGLKRVVTGLAGNRCQKCCDAWVLTCPRPTRPLQVVRLIIGDAVGPSSPNPRA